MQAGGRLLEPADHPQGRGLAAARTGPRRLKNSPSMDLEVDVVHGDDVAERLGHLDEPDVDVWHG